MDTSATYARAARLALPHAIVVVDRFHLVALANRAVTEYRRELAWARRGRRGRKIDPEWAQRNRLLRAAETLTDDEAAKMHDAMRARGPVRWAREVLAGKGNAPPAARPGRHRPGPQPDLAAADRLLHALRRLRDRTSSAGSPGPSTPGSRRSSRALLTGISNGRTEGYNRIVKHVGRIAFGFRNTENQKRRIRFACTRASRRAPTRTLKPC